MKSDPSYRIQGMATSLCGCLIVALTMAPDCKQGLAEAAGVQGSQAWEARLLLEWARPEVQRKLAAL